MYRTPPNPKQNCKEYRYDGPTPCRYPHCDCIKPDWPKPKGCTCTLLRERERCYEQCEPPHWGILEDTTLLKPRLPPVPGVLFFVVALILLVLFSGRTARGADADPYSCYGGGRYEAMSEAAPACNDMPRYCVVIRNMARNCTSAKLLVKMWGTNKAEQRARACGALDTDITEARACLKQDESTK